VRVLTHGLGDRRVCHQRLPTACVKLLHPTLDMYQPKQRVTVDLSNLTIQGVSFSQNVQKALGSVVRQVSAEPSVYLVELLFSFKGIKLVEVPEERMRVA
jgi:hypothetical protein